MIDREKMLRLVGSLIYERDRVLETASSPDIIFIRSDIQTLRAIETLIRTAPDVEEAKSPLEIEAGNNTLFVAVTEEGSDIFVVFFSAHGMTVPGIGARVPGAKEGDAAPMDRALLKLKITTPESCMPFVNVFCEAWKCALDARAALAEVEKDGGK